jgi:hypothetical protein
VESVAGTWSGARTALRNELNGLAITSPVNETLTVHEHQPDTTLTTPYAYIVAPARTVTRAAGGQRITEPAPKVRVLLEDAAVTNGYQELAERHDAWIDKLVDALDDALTLNGNADLFEGQEFSELSLYEPENLYGFEMTVTGLRISETKTFTP